MITRIILSSKSPRRQSLLRLSGFVFDIETLDVDESFPDDMPALEVAPYLSRVKAEAFLPNLKPGELLITSDTTVVLNNKIYNKPQDYDDGVRILSELSGNKHTVVTGVTLISSDRELTFAEHAYVQFKKISPEGIRYYLDNYKPYDKAGAYAIQEWIGLTHIERIEGSYANIMGLPTERLYEELKSWPLSPDIVDKYVES